MLKCTAVTVIDLNALDSNQELKLALADRQTTEFASRDEAIARALMISGTLSTILVQRWSLVPRPYTSMAVIISGYTLLIDVDTMEKIDNLNYDILEGKGGPRRAAVTLACAPISQRMRNWTNIRST